jgi:hypothetical protein
MCPFFAAADVIVRDVIHDYSGGYAVGWFTLSLINAGLAQSKNRSGLGWWFGSLFIGPIATLLIVVLDKLPNRFALHTSQPTDKES